MKKQYKIILITVFAVLLSILATVSIAASAITNDAQLSKIQVTTDGNINIKFIYTNLGDAEKFVAEIYDADGNLFGTDEFSATDVAKAGNVVKVSLAPSQMAYKVKVHAVDADGKTGAVRAYSVCDYAWAVLNDQNLSEHHSAMRALLNWGAMADERFTSITESAVNKGLYSRDTNPVDDAIAFFDDANKGTVESTDNIIAEKYYATLGSGDTTMTFVVSYTGDYSEDLSATVTKGENGEACKTSIKPLEDEDGKYAVTISNVGVAVYNTPYTVEITDGKETFSATKTMLEYLDILAFNAEHEEDHAVAKAMYQFYTHTAGKTAIAGCTHANGFHTSYDVDGANEHLTCSDCLTDIRTFPKTVKYYADMTSVWYYDNKLGGANTKLPFKLGADGEWYTSAVPSGEGAIMNVFPASCKQQEIKTELGKYLAIKYRATGEGSLGLSVILGGGTQVDKTITSGKTDGWVVAVMDMSSYSGYTTDGAQKLTVTLVPRITVDLAYVAVSDDINDIRALLGENETYVYRGISFSNAGHTLKKTELPTEHTAQFGSKNNGDSTTYTYACSSCGTSLAKSVTVPKAVTAFWYGKNLNYYDANVTPTSYETSKTKIENGIMFQELKPLNTNGKQMALSAELNSVLGQYVMIKYRVTAVGTESNELYFRLGIDGNKATQETLNSGLTDGWAIAVIDISEYSIYDTEKVSSETAQTLKLEITVRSAIDLAYIAVSNDITALRSLLDDGETYYDRGNSFSNAGVEFDKNGICVGEHNVVVTSSTGDVSTIYTYSCSVCGQTIAASRTILNTVAYYSNVQSIRTYDGNKVGEVFHTPIAKDGEVFTRIAPTNITNKGKQMQTFVTRTASSDTATVTRGRYFAIKFRLNETDGVTNNEFCLTMDINGVSGGYQENKTFAVGKWITLVIDLAGYNGYDKTLETQALKIAFTHRMTLDVAYIAVADDITQIVEDPTYTYYNEGSFNGAGVVYNKDGTLHE